MQNTTNELPRLVPGQVVELPLTAVQPDPDQPRTIFDEERLNALALDIRARRARGNRGVEQPIIVRSDGERYLIKDGERRWRASHIAECETIPCLLAEPGPEERADLERFLDQALNNENQEKLNPIDKARFLQKLTTVHGLAVKDVPAELAKRGIEMSRPYVSNIIRLLDLPYEFQQYIADGKLSANNGKSLLSISSAPKVVASVADDLEKAFKSGDGITAEALDSAIVHGIEDNHERLYNGRGKKCENRKVYTSTHGYGEVSFCQADECACLKKAQAKEAAAASGEEVTKPAGPTKAKPNKHGVIILRKLDSDTYHALGVDDVDFDPTTCEGCEHRKLANYSPEHDPKYARHFCFNIPCFDEKTKAAKKSHSQREQVCDWLDPWVFNQVKGRLPGDDALQYQIMVWMALGAPVNTARENNVGNELASEVQELSWRQKSGAIKTPSDVMDRFEAGTLPTERIATCGLQAMLKDRGHLYTLARRIGVELSPKTFRIDGGYIELKKKPELAAMLRGLPPEAIVAAAVESLGEESVGTGIAKSDPAHFIKQLEAGKVDALKSFCLSNAIIDAVGVPEDVADAWTNTVADTYPVFEDEMEDDDAGAEEAKEPAEEEA